jgi:hypothetical protein
VLKKGKLSPLILEIIGGVIVVAIVLILFSGFAAPFLEFLSDSKNIEAFNKFTAAQTRACREGSETVPYFNLGFQSQRKIYAISLVSGQATTAIRNMPNCEIGATVTPCSSSNDKERLAECTGNAVCWCLLKVTYRSTGSNNPYCPSWEYNAITVDSSDINNIRTKWDAKLKGVLSSSEYFDRVSVLQCTEIQDAMGCEAQSGGATVPVLPKARNQDYLVWIQSDAYNAGLLLGVRDIILDSISFDRPIKDETFDDHMLFTSNPALRITTRDDAKIWQDNCPGVA